METNIKPKEAAAIIDSLTAGVVPNIGVQQIVVGRQAEVNAIVDDLNRVIEGQNVMKLWIGDFGSGKSFMFHLMKVLALKMKFVVASADFTPENRLYSNDGKAVALYRQLMSNLSIQTKPEGGALTTLIEKWIGQITSQVALDHQLSMTQLQETQNQILVEQEINKVLGQLTDSGSFDMSMVIMRYYQGYVSGNDQLCKCAIKWLQGEYTTKTEAKADLGVREIINDLNYYDILKCLSALFVSIGYSGLMVNLDEAINLYKIQTQIMREKNYEKLLSIYNDCYQGQSRHLFVNVAGTKDFLFNERRGLYSYDALKTRLQPNQYATGNIRDFSQPVIVIEPIGHEDILILLKNLLQIFNVRYNTQLQITEAQIISFMEEIYNKPGASEFLLPREVIRDFLNILNALRQNPNVSFSDLVKKIEIDTTSALDQLDNITVL